MFSHIRFSGAWVVAFTFFLALAGWLEINGFISDSTIQQWGRTILQSEGPVGFRASEALYPPLPFVGYLVLHQMVGAHGIPIPTLFSALVAGLLAAVIFSNLRSHGGHSRLSALGIVVLTVANPLFLFSVATSPELSLLCLGVWIWAGGLTAQRAQGGAHDLMKVGMGLMIMGLSSTYGLLICFAAMPFMAMAVPPRMLETSTHGTLLAIAFPLLCAVGSLLFVGMIFDLQLIAQPIVFAGGQDTRLFALALLICALPAVVIAAKMFAARQDAIPIIAAAGSIGGGMMFDFHLGHIGDSLQTAIPFLILAPIAASLLKQSALRTALCLAILTASWLGGLYVTTNNGHPATTAWATAIGGGVAPTTETTQMVAFLNGRTDVLIDAEQHTGLITARGGLDGLLISGSPEFESLQYGSRPENRYIVMANTQAVPTTKDRLARRFSDLNALSDFGYAPVLELTEWIVFEKQNQRRDQTRAGFN